MKNGKKAPWTCIARRHRWIRDAGCRFGCRYFDEQPVINRDKVAKKDEERRKSSTHNMPAFSLTDGLGEEFLSWLSTPCGGGKSHKQGIQIGRRAMKFLMASMGATEVDKHVDEEYVDCCLGSPCIIMNFLKVITEQWKIGSSAALNYMKSINTKPL